MPRSKCSSAKNATAASNAYESAAVNRRSVRHAARHRKRSEIPFGLLMVDAQGFCLVASSQASTCLLGPRWTKEIIETVH